jgi:hypothetical protein
MRLNCCLLGSAWLALLIVSTGCASATYRNLQYTVRRELPEDPEQRLAMSYCADVAQRKVARANSLEGAGLALGTVAVGSTALWIAGAMEDAESSTIETSVGGALTITTAVAALALLIWSEVSAVDGDDAALAAVQIRGEDAQTFKFRDYADCEPRESDGDEAPPAAPPPPAALPPAAPQGIVK